jgi:hypothetical protein
VLGPLSECSRHVYYDNAVRGATVYLLRTRGPNTDQIGKTTAATSSGIVPLDPAQILLGGDLITAYQADSTGASPWQTDVIKVQKSIGKFHPPQVLTHLYSCSRGFVVGGMRPGTRVEVLQGNTVIGEGLAVDGTASVRMVDSAGLPAPGTVLTVRQRVCPVPPPPGNAPEWVIDDALPPVESMQSPGGPFGEVPAPVITAGAYACSRSLAIEQIIPGAEVVVESRTRGWWVSLDPADVTKANIALPVTHLLKEGDELAIRQEFGCRTTSARNNVSVGPQEQLAPPYFTQIDCASSPTLTVGGLKDQADVEIEVLYQGETKVYRTVATKRDPDAFNSDVTMPLISVGATVRMRQGECDKWSDWSEPPVLANALMGPAAPLRIVGDLFDCQAAIPVENISPLSGVLVATSNTIGEIGHTSIKASNLSISVSPHLFVGHDIKVEHHVCGQVQGEGRHVKPLAPPSIGDVAPLFDGDTTVTVRHVTSEAYLEIWSQDERLANGNAPYSTNGLVDVSFQVKSLTVGQHIHAKFWYCGHYGRNEGRQVLLRKPELESVNPSSVFVPSSDPTAFNLHGRYFRPGAAVWFEGAGLVNTQFQSTTDLLGLVPGYHVATPGTKQVQVRNPDGQVTGVLDVHLVARSPESPPASPPGSASPPKPQTVGFDKVNVYNCNTNHRDVHIWNYDLTVGGPWVFVATLNPQFDDYWGTCPAQGSEPLAIDLVDGHDMMILAIDPQNPGCIMPGDDPHSADPPKSPEQLNLACRRLEMPFHGKTGGGTTEFSFK